jgi:hypothetical protein
MAGITWNRFGIFGADGAIYHWQQGGRTVDGLEGGSPWHEVKGIDWSALHEARLQAHYAVQWLARAARAYVTPRPDDHHTNLGWDDAIAGLTTQALPQGTVLGLKLSDLTLMLWAGRGQAGSPAISLPGRRDAEIRQWLGSQLGARSLDPDALDTPSPYQLPEHPIGRGAPYGAAGLAPALTELAAWYANADRALGGTRQRLVARGIDAPPVRCWPHHFDLDSLVSLGAGAGARTVGLGFAPGDEYYDQPYFYVSSYPSPDVASLPALPPVGHWHSHHFTAAVALAERILQADDRQAATGAFLRAATDILIA